MSTRNRFLRGQRRGFTLLEVMAAFVIAALMLTAVSSASSSAVVGAARAYRQNVAAMLMRGVVLDIEEEYKQDGFPTNDQMGENCDLPDPFDDDFSCEYDLRGLELDPGTMSEMATTAMSQIFGGPGAGGGGDDEGGGMPDITQLDPGELAGRLEGSLSGQAAMVLGMAAANPALLEVCGLNLQQAVMNMQMSAAFFPTIVEKASEVTRKLTIRITWANGRRTRNRGELVVETFIVAIPEEQEEFMKQMGRAEDAGLLDQGNPTDPSQTPPATGRGK